MQRSSLSLLALVLAIGCGDHPLPVSEETVPDGPSEARVGSQDDYVITPAGRYHRSCVHEIPDGARVSKDRRVELSDGTTYQLPTCSYPIYRNLPDLSAKRIEPHSPTTNGWVEFAWDILYGGDQYREISAYWTVPEAPYHYDDQLYFSFPGLQSDSSIIQPVLVYGEHKDFGGDYWSMASWICGPSCIHSTPYESVSAGDSIYGLVTAVSCASGDCQWRIRILDVSKSVLRGLVVTDTEDYHIAIGGAVEPYRLTSCAQYPVEGISYSGITLYDDNWDQVTPGWHKVVNDTGTPLCDFDVDYTTTAVDLLHDTWPPGVTIGGPSIVHPDWSCYWTSSVSPGVSPYSYTWSGVLSGTGSSVWGTVSSSGDLRVDVEDAAEKTGYAYKWITVSESAPYHPNCAEK